MKEVLAFYCTFSGRLFLSFRAVPLSDVVCGGILFLGLFGICTRAYIRDIYPVSQIPEVPQSSVPGRTGVVRKRARARRACPCSTG